VTPATSAEEGYLPTEILILFQHPTHSYVTPKFYTSTKPSTGKVVPTWNYAAVQVYGRLRLHYTGESADTFLQEQVTALSQQQEAAWEVGKRWQVSDAPKSYVELLKKGIIGLEVEVASIEGRWKMSQEMGEGDWKGVTEGFKEMGGEVGSGLSKMVEIAGARVGRSVSRDEKV